MATDWNLSAEDGYCFRVLPDAVAFPAPSNIQINMMPFKMGDLDSIPKEYHAYAPMIEACLGHVPNERGRVGYLTIDERVVEAGQTHRRAGLHTDRHPNSTKGGDGQVSRWGGSIPGYGGLFLGSNVPDSCSLLDCWVDAPGPHGDCEHLRGSLLEELTEREVGPTTMLPNRIYWINDTTPHESLPLPNNTPRQFFRLVTSNVSHWFRKHSTANPLGTVSKNLGLTSYLYFCFSHVAFIFLRLVYYYYRSLASGNNILEMNDAV